MSLLVGENERRRANLSLCSLFPGNRSIIIVERFVSQALCCVRSILRKRSSHRDPDHHLFLSGSLAVE